MIGETLGPYRIERELARCANVAETSSTPLIRVQGGGASSDDEQQHSAGGDPGARVRHLLGVEPRWE